MDNKEKLKYITNSLLKDSYIAMLTSIDKAIDNGAIDIDNWDETMIIPKSIMIAVLNNEADQYSAKGTSFEKQVKKESKNISLFI